MEFVVLRRANQSTERGDQPPALEPGVFMRPSDSAVRLARRAGVWTRSTGPYPPREIVAGFTLVQAPSRADVVEQVRWWPLFDAGAVYEIREQRTFVVAVDTAMAALDTPVVASDSAAAVGAAVAVDAATALVDAAAASAAAAVGTTVATVAAIRPAAETAPERHPDWTRYVVFLRADAASEAGLVAGPEAAESLRVHEQRSVRAGVLLGGSMLTTTRTATRVRFANANTSLAPGPFMDVTELVAGYWIIQAATLDAAIAWASGCPTPHDGDVTLEIREVCERREQREFTPEMRAAEEQLRAELLEGVLREAIQKRRRAL